ncbi:MAG: hypothetical protein N3A02_08340 [Rectinema sp.]|nr:hypothetical protein [Rectinema sp.]
MTPQELAQLDYERASDMLLAYATDAKKYEMDIVSLRAQAADWISKAQRAREGGFENLAAQAEQEAAACTTKALELEHELAGIRRDIEDLRTALPVLKAKQRRVDPDLLLAELTMLIGRDEHGTAPAAPSEKPGSDAHPSSDLDDALTALKKKMGML